MTRSDVERAVREAVHEVVPGATVDVRRHLKEIGADSVDRVEIILRLMDRFAVSVPMASFSELPDINALIDHLCEVRTR